jgi:hypothetical protein
MVFTQYVMLILHLPLIYSYYRVLIYHSALVERKFIGRNLIE